MKRKRSKNRFQDERVRTSRHHSNRGIFVIMVLGSGVMMVFYLLGKIEIDLIQRENGQLEQERQSVQHEIEDIQVQIDRMKGYQQVVHNAKMMGLDFLSPERLAELPVDLKGLENAVPQMENELQYAGVEPFGIEWIIEQKLKKAGGENGMD